MASYKKLSQREHILQYPDMYIGGATEIPIEGFYLIEDSFQYTSLTYSPGFFKIINEIIDNAFDEGTKTDFKYGNKIDVTITKDTVTVKDNGRGIPVIKDEVTGQMIPTLCWANPLAGSNFDKSEEDSQKGNFGVGAYATAVFSKEFVGETYDGKKKMIVKLTNNATKVTEKVTTLRKKRTGTIVTFKPDLERFGINEIDEKYINLVKQRLLNLSIAHPETAITLNGNPISFQNKGKNAGKRDFEDFVKMFSAENYVVYASPDNEVKIALYINLDDTFRTYANVNGLFLSKGGTHIKYVIDTVIGYLRDRLQRKFKGIKPGDIRNRLHVVSFFGNFGKPKWGGQMKEELLNPQSDITRYLQAHEVDLEKLCNDIYKKKEMVKSLTEIYALKESRKEEKELERTLKKRRYSPDYIPSLKKKKYLLLCEGLSAKGGLLPVLKRQEIGYYILGGKIKNIHGMGYKGVLSSEKLKELYSIIKNEGYEYVLTATDADPDGIHIQGLLINFMNEVFPEILQEERFGLFKTPLMVVTKKRSQKPLRFIYSLSSEIALKDDETVHYKKGLGEWKASELEEVLRLEGGIEKMIEILDASNGKEYIQKWFKGGKDASEGRRGLLSGTRFDIAMT